jgi:GGDEF domain-containing protein
VNKPSGVGLFFFPSSNDELGTVSLPPLIRFMRPVTFGLWLAVFGLQMYGVASGSAGINWLVLTMSTALFAGVHTQFWLDESEQGRRIRDGFERMRGQIYEDEETGMPNSRHFVFQLRRQMMRSVRNGRGFSIVLATLGTPTGSGAPSVRDLRMAAGSMKAGLGECDFVARLQGSSFGAIVLDETDATATDKSDLIRETLIEDLQQGHEDQVHVVVSMTGYEGELEVRDFLRRAQRDLQAGQELIAHPGVHVPTAKAA